MNHIIPTDSALAIIKIWTAGCLAQTGSPNTFKGIKGQHYCFTTRCNNDGGIIGDIFRINPNSETINSQGLIVRKGERVGDFRIYPDGSICRAHKPLKDMIK